MVKQTIKKPKLKEKVILLQKQIDNLNNKWRRALADYQNLEKRIVQERRELVKFSNASLIDKLLEVLDNLERSFKHLKDKGLALAINQFESILTAEGVQKIQAKGKKFDPLLMDCFEVVDGAKDIIIEVVQNGYLLNKKVLRPAKVKVGRGKNKKGGNQYD